MARLLKGPVQQYRGTADQIKSYVGAEGELVYNVTESRWHAMDGATPGGVPHAKLSELEAFTMPSAAYICGLSPLTYRRPEMFTPDRTQVVVPAHTWVTVGGRGLVSTKDTYLSLSDFDLSGQAGKDAYLYACWPASDTDTEPVFVLSANSTVPDGYTADSSRKIGGFHQLCASVGTISGHTLSGYTAGEVLPLSAWDLYHRAVSDNEGMVWVANAGSGVWLDIYDASWSGSALQSVFGGTVVTGTSATPMHGEKFVENFGLIKKRLMWRDEFVIASKGSNEGTNISGSANPGTTGGHNDTAGRRMISNYGLEDCCGAFWQWTSDMFGGANSAYPSSLTLENAFRQGGVRPGAYWYLDVYRWDDPTLSASSSPTSNNTNIGYSRLYHRDIDGDDTGKFGDMYGGLARFLVGAAWDDGAGCGSRSVGMCYLSARVNSAHAARGAAGPRAVGPF